MKTGRILWPVLGLAVALVLAGCAATPTKQAEVGPPPTEAEASASTTPQPSDTPAPGEEEYILVTVLPPDAIRAIDDPEFYDVLSADLEYSPGEMVLGVVVEGTARAYSLDVLAQYEIINDTVNGQPLAVTY